jgi:hypothetical protein
MLWYCDGYTFEFDDPLDQYMLNDIQEGYFLRMFDSKIIAVGVRFDDSYFFLVLFVKHTLKIVN